MKAKFYLSQIKYLDRKIQDILEQIEVLSWQATSMTVAPKEDCIQSSGDPDKLGSAVAKIADLEADMDAIIDRFSRIKSEAKDAIRHIPNEKYQEILFMHYFDYKSIYVIAAELDMTDNGVKKAHKRALEEFTKAWNTIFCAKC